MISPARAPEWVRPQHLSRDDLPAAVALYLDTVEAAGRRLDTVYRYRKALTALGPHPLALDALAIGDILDRYPNLNSRAVRLTILRQFYRFCIKRGLTTIDPSADIPIPRAHRKQWRLVTEEEFTRLRQIADPLVGVLATILYRVGSRISESVAIRAEHVTLEGDAGIIDFPYRKGGEAGYAAFGEDAAAVLREWLPEHPGWLFPHTTDPTHHLSQGMAWHRLAQAGKEAGIPGPLAPHRFRHSFATRAADAGWNQLALQQQLGHRNPSSTAWYYHPSRKGLLLAYQKAERGG